MNMRSNPETKVWKFCENRNIVFFIDELKGNQETFENEFLRIHGNTITIFGEHLKGYAWDGCTPKWEVLDFLPGTPDGVIRKQLVRTFTTDNPMELLESYSYVPKTYYASLVHDILYQFKSDIPLSRKTTDRIFLEMMEYQRFKPAKLYYFMVRLIGGIYGNWRTK